MGRPGDIDVALLVKPHAFDPIASVGDELAEEGSLGAAVALAERGGRR